MPLNFFKKRSKQATVAQRARSPAGCVVYAVGDIHGCAAELDRLLESIAVDMASRGLEAHLVFLGDYVDRGPDSAGVLQRLCEGPLPGQRHSFLMGNHEEAMLSVLDGELDVLRSWLRYGGIETLESYGLSRADILRLGTELPRKMREVIPEAHINFVRAGEDCVRTGDYFFVHAGIRPGIPLDQQDVDDLRWIRDEFLSDAESDHGAMIVHGHTITPEPEITRNRIGIDTGCYESGRLTALVLNGEERSFLTS